MATEHKLQYTCLIYAVSASHTADDTQSSSSSIYTEEYLEIEFA